MPHSQHLNRLLHATAMNFCCVGVVGYLAILSMILSDRNKEELERFYEVADEALRGHFAELYTLLASREQQMQHELFQRFQERTGSLNNAKRYIRKGQLDFSKRLQKATNAVSSDIPPSESAIARLTESIRQSNSCKNLVDETRENYAHHLRHDPVATVRSEYEGASYWNRLLSQFIDLKQEKDRQSLDHLSSTSPCEPTEKKGARKHTHMNSSPLAINHYGSGMIG
ncbi:LOW QUALITY PROTEIN: hypothetical protein DAPPUDRAFT_251503 [Daphnia pulex]|uniref:Uncharacterized protein n=1 Tax=Daphnia pulex TaxID=6669 RepID=E9H0K0_DAPPU|nr:LOW QUALITY PROTEIN: hypothetical protein DAPPUDRAFT_251503 [Daphnia pulex]|eukprot:EFX74661.1 LOW QUALITY PROTEIN: hypothetical protein DAPPUDRAFT_251503 [Daphnia pulex]